MDIIALFIRLLIASLACLCVGAILATLTWFHLWYRQRVRLRYISLVFFLPIFSLAYLVIANFVANLVNASAPDLLFSDIHQLQAASYLLQQPLWYALYFGPSLLWGLFLFYKILTAPPRSDNPLFRESRWKGSCGATPSTLPANPDE